MQYKEHIHNSSVVLNPEGSCTINCPGCSFAVKERKETNKLSVNEVKKRIDFSVDKLLSNKDGTFLILLPGNVLLDYNSQDIEEILLYACSKHERVQWELEKIDERILDIFSSEIILDLLSKQKFFLNIGYIDGNLGLLKKIFNELAKIGGGKLKKILEDEGLYEKIKKLDDSSKLIEIYKLREKGIFPEISDLTPLSIHFSKFTYKTLELLEFLEYAGFNSNLGDIQNILNNGGHLLYDGLSSGVAIELHSTMNQLIDKHGNNIWDIEYKKGYEECTLLSRDFEWSLGGDKEGTILPHVNPCINKISFGNLESSEEEIEENFQNHKDKIKKILKKHKYKKDFNQSELCRICLDGEEEELNILDYLKYIVRKQVFITKDNFKSIINLIKK